MVQLMNLDQNDQFLSYRYGNCLRIVDEVRDGPHQTLARELQDPYVAPKNHTYHVKPPFMLIFDETDRIVEIVDYMTTTKSLEFVHNLQSVVGSLIKQDLRNRRNPQDIFGLTRIMEIDPNNPVEHLIELRRDLERFPLSSLDWDQLVSEANKILPYV